ncbi:hypothetical protein IEE94_15085 [Yimella sp. cx-573]|nr:hypothetical protein [Yimella sp. cx-573]
MWVTDFTYVRTWDRVFVYTSFIVDCYAQRIVAWHWATTKTTDLVMTPLRMALIVTVPRNLCLEPDESGSGRERLREEWSAVADVIVGLSRSVEPGTYRIGVWQNRGGLTHSFDVGGLRRSFLSDRRPAAGPLIPATNRRAF